MNLEENFPFKVREGSEKLVKVTASASDKIFRLIERESKGDFCEFESLEVAVMVCHIK